MGEQLDYTTLKWVKDEIQESLNQTQQALEAYIDQTQKNVNAKIIQNRKTYPDKRQQHY